MDKDNDCNGLVDENLATTVYYMDNDGDGYGGGSAGDFCSDPGFGYTLISGDCDDDNNEINPGAIEIPGNGIDENCDGLDEISTSIEVTYQVDITQYLAQGNVLSDDGMRIGGNFADFNATSNGNSMLNWTPIDDASAMANLGNNIWSITVSYPTSFSGQTQFYKFVNGDWGMNEGDLATLIITNGCGNDDGAGNINRTFVIPTINSIELNCYNTCGNCPELEDNDQDGFTSDVDCDDNDPTVYPGAPELCDGKDNDCNGLIDDNATTTIYYFDNDNDGFGSGFAGDFCENPGAGYALNNNDCNDNDPNIRPGATEICDGIDNNCNGFIDEGLPTSNFYVDNDGDGYGTGLPQAFCSNPGIGYSNLSGDCNDNNPDINPGAIEIPNNGIDEDCDGFDLGASLAEIGKLDLKIIPNPGSKSFTIILNEVVVDYKFSIYNATGEKLNEQLIKGNNHFTFETTTLESGVYFIKIETREINQLYKWVKVN
jgi:large repetitive protein